MYQTSSQQPDELRCDCSCLLRDHHPPSKINITPVENRAIKELREDQLRVVFTADKGVAMVVMDRQDCKDKALSLFADANTYRTINKDPTTKLSNQLINTLKYIKQSDALNDSTYKKVFPPSTVPPKFYGLPKIHKVGTSLRPIVSSRGSITYGVAKILAGIICPLLGQSLHHLKTLNILRNTSSRSNWSQGKPLHHLM